MTSRAVCLLHFNIAAVLKKKKRNSFLERIFFFKTKRKLADSSTVPSNDIQGEECSGGKSPRTIKKTDQEAAKSFPTRSYRKLGCIFLY